MTADHVLGVLNFGTPGVDATYPYLKAAGVPDFVLFAGEFGGVVFGISAGCEVSAEAHGDGAGGDLCKSGDDDEVCARDCSQTGCERERDGEAVG